MANFNTNQALHLYVAKAKKEVASGADPSETLVDAGDIAVQKVMSPDGKSAKGFVLAYRNADGMMTASEFVGKDRVEYLSSIEAEKLAIVLRQATVTLADDVTLADLKGKHVQVIVTLREYIGFDFSESYPIVADVYVSGELAASEEKLYAAIEKELKATLRGFQANKPFDVSSSASGVVIGQVQQRFVLGKMSAEPINFDVTVSSVPESGDIYNLIPWGKVESADRADGGKVSGDYRIAELERFSHGERGDEFRESVWPLNREVTYLVKPEKDKFQYGMLNIRHFYCGGAEDVQKSPRDICVAAPDAVIADIKAAVEAIVG